jgi:hypothetical protein
VRNSTSIPIRLLTWAALGLLLTSSSPHFHLAESAAPGHAAHHDGAGSGEPTTVSADEHHEQHTSQPPHQAHPCGLCRSTEDEPLGREAWVAMPTDVARAALIPGTGPQRLASLFASLHPARAPPIHARA